MRDSNTPFPISVGWILMMYSRMACPPVKMPTSGSHFTSADTGVMVEREMVTEDGALGTAWHERREKCQPDSKQRGTYIRTYVEW